MIIACEVAVIGAWVVEVQTTLAFARALCQDIHAIIGAVENNLHEARMGRIAKIRTTKLKGEHVTDHRLVRERSEKRPIVVLAHAQERHLLLLATLFKRLREGLEAVGFLVRTVERRIAAILEADITVIVGFLVWMGNGVTIVFSILVVDNLHSCRYAFISLNGLALDINKSDWQIRFCKFYVTVVCRHIVVGTLSERGCGPYGDNT